MRLFFGRSLNVLLFSLNSSFLSLVYFSIKNFLEWPKGGKSDVGNDVHPTPKLFEPFEMTFFGTLKTL